MYKTNPKEEGYKILEELREFRRLFINNTKKGYISLSRQEYLDFKERLDLEIKKLVDILPL